MLKTVLYHPPTPAIFLHPPDPPIALQSISRDAPFTEQGRSERETEEVHTKLA
jgi:hypothetical protein